MPAPDLGDEMSTWIWQITAQGVRDLARQGLLNVLRKGMARPGSIRGVADQGVLLKESSANDIAAAFARESGVSESEALSVVDAAKRYGEYMRTKLGDGFDVEIVGNARDGGNGDISVLVKGPKSAQDLVEGAHRDALSAILMPSRKKTFELGPELAQNIQASLAEYTTGHPSLASCLEPTTDGGARATVPARDLAAFERARDATAAAVVRASTDDPQAEVVSFTTDRATFDALVADQWTPVRMALSERRRPDGQRTGIETSPVNGGEAGDVAQGRSADAIDGDTGIGTDIAAIHDESGKPEVTTVFCRAKDYQSLRDAVARHGGTPCTLRQVVREGEPLTRTIAQVAELATEAARGAEAAIDHSDHAEPSK
ncbi:MAG: hypothetical protein PUJ78_06295 [Coriobacteriaceae bacterium]|nr:hypothetical protein [Coriobacteriaceae bacterium]